MMQDSKDRMRRDGMGGMSGVHLYVQLRTVGVDSIVQYGGTSVIVQGLR